jgi:hypothetical protein
VIVVSVIHSSTVCDIVKFYDMVRKIWVQILESVFRGSRFSTSEEENRRCCVTINLHGVTFNKDVLLSELLSHLMTQFRRRFRCGGKISII